MSPAFRPIVDTAHRLARAYVASFLRNLFALGSLQPFFSQTRPQPRLKTAVTPCLSLTCRLPHPFILSSGAVNIRHSGAAYPTTCLFWCSLAVTACRKTTYAIPEQPITLWNPCIVRFNLRICKNSYTSLASLPRTIRASFTHFNTKQDKPVNFTPRFYANFAFRIPSLSLF